MPVVSASVPNLDHRKMVEMGISPSKAIQIGLQVIFRYGGVDKVNVLLNETVKIKKDYDDLLEINEEQKKKIIQIKEELDFCRKELTKDKPGSKSGREPGKATPRNREDPADRIMSELKEGEGK